MQYISVATHLPSISRHLLPAVDVAASRSTKEANSTSKSNTSEEDDDDVSFLLKLAAAIKYGSILVPEITRPNIIIQALIMISAPVIVAVLLLIKQSRLQQ